MAGSFKSFGFSVGLAFGFTVQTRVDGKVKGMVSVCSLGA